MEEYFKNLVITIMSIIYKCFWFLKIKPNKIVAVSFFGKGYGDSGKYIFDELASRSKNLDLVWLTNDVNGKVPPYIRPVKYNSLKSFYELATARVWIDNSRKKLYIAKRKGQFYLQTWHSNLRLKKIEKDTEDSLTERYVKRCKKDSEMADAFIAGCDFSYNTIRNSFWYDGPIYKTGIPRCDELFNISPKSITKTKRALKIPENYKIFLYAPTFRNSGNINLTGLDDFIVKLQKKYSDKFILLVRFHPISKQTAEENSFVKNVTDHPNMQELINVADILITDYSGSMFDAAISHKPCVLYTPDYEDYLKNERELYFSFDELPFKNTHTFSELGSAITNFDKKEYDKKVDAFLKKVGCFEKGDSAKNVVDLLERKVWGKNVEK